MKPYIILGLFLPFFLGLNGCKDKEVICPTTANTASTIEIMPLGDSRVEGADSHESYRYELWKRLVQNNWDFDFIGSRMDERNYEQVSSLRFDCHHASEGGATTTTVLEILRNEPVDQTPEVALLGIGGNDLLEKRSAAETLANLETIFAELRQLNPNIVIFVEQIAPGLSSIMTPEVTSRFTAYNSGVDSLASSLNTSNSPIIAIDMAAEWTDSYMADDVHYNAAGAKVVSDRYYAAIDAHIPR